MFSKNTETVPQNKYRTHSCGSLTREHTGQTVRLSGWVHSRRDHGGLIFIDLRDRYGITQLTFNPDNQDVFKVAETLRDEWVVSVSGKVAERPPEMVNNKLATGEIEVIVDSIQILSQSKTPPFELAKAADVKEDIRLKYRFFDLRRPELQAMLRQRDAFLAHIRKYMHDQDFTEVQTPILANSSPEGARDYLVPSRLHPGKFYALPQAPQQFKQLLMVGSTDKYFQIAPAFRDEDPRIDRHPGEFYQLDMEMSFVEQEDVFTVIEPLMVELAEKFSSMQIVEKPFPRIPWQEAMQKYGSDKPDLRYELHITDVSGLVKDSGFSVFSEAIKGGGVVHALHVAGGAQFSRKDIDTLTETAKTYGAGGLAYITVKDSPESPIIKYLGEDTAQKIADQIGAKAGDIIFFGADKWLTVCRALGAVREAAADKLGLKDPAKAAWVWVVDFPMYEYNEEKEKIDFSHNPFSMPQGGEAALDQQDPTEILGYQYDLALNGFEISSGAIRNHIPSLMYKAFAIAGYSKQQVDEQFGGMIRAFEYGAPPHGGLAPGVDRLFFILSNTDSIRDIYAFPKNGRAQDVMMNAPSEVDPKQLEELHIKVNLDE